MNSIPLPPSVTRRPLRRDALSLAAAVAAVIAGSGNASAQTSGAFTSSGSLGTGDSDALVGLSTTKTYLDAYNLGEAVNLTVNGVLFTGIAGPNPTDPGIFSTTGLTNVYPGGGINPGGVLGSLTDKFVYGAATTPESFTYTNLVVGQTYVVSFYNRSWAEPSSANTRLQTLNASGASTGTVASYDEDAGTSPAQGNLSVLRYTFQAAGTSQTITFANVVNNYTNHQYGFTLEQTFNNAWTGGTTWTGSTWTGGAATVPNAAGSNANFAAQGSPTVIDLDASQTVGHIQFDGANAWTISSVGGNTLTLQSDVGGAATLSALAGSHTIAPNITLASPTLLKVGPGAITLAGNITGGPANVQIGGGTLTLTGTNTYTGETIIGNGTLEVKTLSDYGVASAIGSRGLADENTTITGVGLHIQGGTLKFTGTTAQSTNRNIRILNGPTGATIDASGASPGATLSFTHTGANTNLFDTGGTRTLTLTGANTGDNTFSIQLIDQATFATSLAKSGVGTWVLNGPDANTATGITTVNSGVLKLAKTGVVAVTGGLSIGTGATSTVVQLGGTGGNQIADAVVPTFAGSGATAGILRTNNLSETIGGLSSTGGAGIVENESGAAGTSTLTLNVTGTQAFDGILRNGDGIGTDGTLAITKSGAGMQTLSGNNSYSGSTVINGGILSITNGNALGSTAAGTTQSGTSELRISGGIAIGAEGISITGGGINNAGALRNFADANTYAGTLTLAGQTRIVADSGSLTFNAATSITGTNQNLIVTGAGDFVVNGAITTGTGFISKDNLVGGGAGTLTLAGANTFTGATTITAGTLKLDYTTQNNSKLSDTSALTLGGVSIQLNGGSHTEIVGSTVLSTATTNTLTQLGGTAVLQLNAVTVNTGAILNVGADNIASTDNLNVNGLLPGFRRGTSWAVNSTNGPDGLIVAYAGYADVNRLSGVIPNDGTANVRIIEAGTPGNVTLTAAPNIINTLQINATGGLTTIAPASSTNVISIGGETAGAIWHLPTAGGLTIGATANDGFLTTGGVDNATPATLTISNDSTANAVTINSVVANNGTDVVSLVKTGPGLLSLAANNTFTGQLTAAGGIVTLSGNNPARPTNVTGSTTITAGGALQLQANAGNTTAGISSVLSNEQTANQPLVLSSGGILQLRADSSVTFAGGNNLGGMGSANVTFDVNRLSSGTNGILTIAPAGFAVSTTTINVTGGNGYTLSVGTINNVAAGGNLTLNPTTGRLIVGGYTANATFSTTLTLSGTATGNSITGAVANPATSGATTLTKVGTGTWTLNGADTYSGAINVGGGTLTLAGNKTGSVGAITVSNTAATDATLNIINGTFALGANNFFVGNAPTTVATGTVNQSGGAVTFTGGNGLLVGNANIANTGNYNLSSGSITTFTSATRGIMLGVNNSAIANFNLSGTGILNMTAASGGGGDAVLQVGRYDSANTNTTALFNQTGGTANVGILSIGGNGTNGTGLVSTLTLTGGIFSANQFPRLALGNTNTSVINIGGTADVTLPAFPTGRGTSSTATINFDGGTLRPLAASATYLGGLSNAFIKAGGAKFDVPSGRDITVTQTLLTHAVSTGGGLTKTGNGQLTLTSVGSSFTGNVLVSGGTLTASGFSAGVTGTLGADSSSRTISVTNGATLSFATNNIFGNGVATGSLPAIVLNASTLTSTRYNAIGDLTLIGSTLTQAATDAGNFEGYQFRGNVTVSGTTPSTIATTNGKADHLGPNTTFNVADVTSSPGTDLTISAPLRNQSFDFGLAAGTLTKTGNGTLQITGTQSYSALDNVAGRTILDTSLPNATITGDGGSLVVNADATGSTVNVNATNTTYFTVSQTLAALNIGDGGTAVLTSTPPPAAPAFAALPEGSLAGSPVQPVPEPGSTALLLGGIATLLGLRRRR